MSAFIFICVRGNANTGRVRIAGALPSKEKATNRINKNQRPGTALFPDLRCDSLGQRHERRFKVDLFFGKMGKRESVLNQAS